MPGIVITATLSSFFDFLTDDRFFLVVVIDDALVDNLAGVGGYKELMKLQKLFYEVLDFLRGFANIFVSLLIFLLLLSDYQIVIIRQLLTQKLTHVIRRNSNQI